MADLLGFIVPDQAIPALEALAVAVVTYVAAWIVRRLFLRFVEHTETPNVVMRRIGRVLQAIIVIAGVLGVLAALQIDVSSVAVTLGAASIALSFALSTLLNNVVAGVLIVADESVRLGDTIRVGELEGRVVRMRARATELETAKGERVFVPNVYLAQNPVKRIARGRKVD